MLIDLPAALEGGAAADTVPDAAMEAIRSRGATHVLIHRDSWPSPQAADALRRWLRDRGASHVADVGSTEIWRLPVRPAS